MKKFITLIIIIISLNCYSQSISISNKSTKEKVILKIILKNNYELKFYENDSLIMKTKYIGEKKFLAKQRKIYTIYYKVDKILKNISIYFFDDIKDFENRRILDYNEELQYLNINDFF